MQKPPKLNREFRDQNRANGQFELSELNSSMNSSVISKGSNSRTGRQYTAMPVNDMSS